MCTTVAISNRVRLDSQLSHTERAFSVTSQQHRLRHMLMFAVLWHKVMSFNVMPSNAIVYIWPSCGGLVGLVDAKSLNGTIGRQ